MRYKRTGKARSNGTWTVERIRGGFERFRKENGRLPTSYEIDDCPYLPTARLIQLKFGGLRSLRESLGYQETDFGSGDSRSQISAMVVKRGLQAECDLEKYLVGRFGEVFVHTEKRFGRGRQRVDFVVYSPDGAFGIDVFCAENLRDMQIHLNIKLRRYVDFPKHVRLFLVVANAGFAQADIDRYCSGLSRLKGSSSVQVVSLTSLYEALSAVRRYEDPLLFQSIATAYPSSQPP